MNTQYDGYYTAQGEDTRDLMSADCSNNVEGYDDDVYEDDSYKAYIDTEAIAWAYKKLLAYGVGNTNMDNAMMLDRLNLMLLE